MDRWSLDFQEIYQRMATERRCVDDEKERVSFSPYKRIHTLRHLSRCRHVMTV